MIRVVAAMFVVGVGAIAWVLLLPDAAPRSSGSPVPQAAAATEQPATAMIATTPAAPERDVRVVYPGPTGTMPVRKLADKVDNEASTHPAVAPSASSAAAETVTVAAATPPASVAAALSPAPPAIAVTGPTLDINTASVEQLNNIPGAGRIGRTIASHRPYKSIDELLSKRVVRKNVYEKIKDQIAAN